MPSYFLKQPDGLIAIFSSVVDDFTGYNFTPDEALAYGTEQWGKSTAEEKLERAIKDEGLWEPYTTDDGLGRWRETLETIAFQHGLKHLKSVLEEMGHGDAEIPQAAIDAAEDVESDMDPESEEYTNRV